MDPREELAEITRMVRAYVEWQVECGAHGTPRDPSRRIARGDAAGPVADAQPADATAAATAPVALPEAGPTTLAASLAGAPSTMPFGSTPTPITLVSASDAVSTLSQPNKKPAPVSTPPAAPLPPEARARELVVLAEKVAGCMQCGLGSTRRKTVFARGNPLAELCFVGEGPGAEEDASGLPFVGKAGQLLDRMIVAMGLDPERDVYVCNVVKCRPPSNRRPEPGEVAACMPYLHAQLALVRPKCIVALGNTAVAGLLGTRLGITRIRGTWKLYKGDVMVMPTYHPSHLLRDDGAQHKKEVWEDLQKVMKHMGLSPPPRF